MFDQIIGNENIKKYLIKSIKNKTNAHSLIFSGKSGIGKKLFAREYAKNIMCLEEGKCNKSCSSCVKFEADSNPDFLQIEKDKNTIKIEQIRKLQEEIYKMPIISEKKVYIINDADAMTKEAQNCFLKTLEEPPEYAVIILIVSNESKLLETIKSRCVKIQFQELNKEEIKQILKDTDDDIIELLDGSLENAYKIEKIKDNYIELKRIVENIKTKNTIEVLNNSELLYDSKDDIIDLLNYMNTIAFKNRMLSAISIIEKTKRKIMLNNNYEMCIDNMLINIIDTI